MKEKLGKYIKKYAPSIDEGALNDILDKVPVKAFKKGSVLAEQGEVSEKFYFVIEGCVRKYFYDEDGREVTADFYTEEQVIALFNTVLKKEPFKYFLECTEDCVLVVGDFETERVFYSLWPQLRDMNMEILEHSYEKTQDYMAAFIASTPEERYLRILKDRAGLAERVPQHQLASYLGITPESLSRIKKRLASEAEAD